MSPSRRKGWFVVRVQPCSPKLTTATVQAQRSARPFDACMRGCIPHKDGNGTLYRYGTYVHRNGCATHDRHTHNIVLHTLWPRKQKTVRPSLKTDQALTHIPVHTYIPVHAGPHPERIQPRTMATRGLPPRHSHCYSHCHSHSRALALSHFPSHLTGSADTTAAGCAVAVGYAETGCAVTGCAVTGCACACG